MGAAEEERRRTEREKEGEGGSCHNAISRLIGSGRGERNEE